MRSTQDPIRGLQRNIEEWGLATEQELKALDKAAKAEVDEAVEEAKASPEPLLQDLWADIYFKGTEPPTMRGREREEVSFTLFNFHYLVIDFVFQRSTSTRRMVLEPSFIPLPGITAVFSLSHIDFIILIASLLTCVINAR